MRRVIVLLLIILLSSFWPISPIKAANASLYLSPSTGVYTVGNTFSITVKVNTGGMAINAAEGTLVYSSDKLEVVSLSKSGSIFSLWTTEPIFSNSNGTVEFGGGAPNPGYTGAAGQIITITFKAKISGTATISFSSGAVLANDGQGTNILGSLGNGSYTLQVGVVTPPAPTPTTVPTAEPTRISAPPAPTITSVIELRPDNWINSNNPEFKWDLTNDITGVSIMLTDKPDSNPGSNSDGLFNSKTYENLADGAYYLHLKLKNNVGWSPITHFKIQIDTQPPHPFEVIVEEGTETDNPQPTLRFETTDDFSGLSFYEVITGEQEVARLNLSDVKHNPYRMRLSLPGRYNIIVKAVDQAGNNTLAMTTINILPIELPIITEYPQSLLPGDILTLKGTSLPEATVLVYVQRRGEEASGQAVESSQDGRWSYTYDRPIEGDIYKVWVQAVDKRGAQSLPSEKITISAQQPIFLRVGEVIVEHLTVAISLLASLALLALIFLYSWWKIRVFAKRLKKETKEAEEALHRAFDALKEEAEEEIKLLNKVKSKRDLTREEKRIKSNLKDNLAIAEKYIEKEIKDIGEIRWKTSIKEWLKKIFK